MAPTLTALVRRLRRLAAPDLADPDADLLRRFARRADQDAFAALVARHGAMVLGVCRRVLGDAHAAEDAFQAAFLVLARKAASLGRPAALAGWLHGVARRVALKARGRTRRGGALADAPEPTDPRPDPPARLAGRELLAALEEEVQRLPEAQRLAVVLCRLEGLSQEEAARRLGCTAGTVRGRLERGRARLRERFLRRGLTLPAALAAVEAVRASAPAALARLGTSAAKAATLFAAGPKPAGAATAAAVALAEGVLKDMVRRTFRAVFLLAVLAASLGVAGGLLAWQTRAAETAPPTPWSRGEGPAAAGDDNLKNTIWALERSRNEAVATGDWRTTAKFLADDHVSVSAYGRHEKAALVESARHTRLADLKTRDVEARRVNEGAVVLTYVYSCRVLDEDGVLERFSGRRSGAVLARRASEGGPRWRVGLTAATPA